MRWVLSIFLIVLVISLTGCNTNPKPPVNQSNFIDYSKPRVNYTQKVANNKSILISEDEPIQGNQMIDDRDYMIGTFNIQVFGRTKSSNKVVYTTIVDIIDDYDIIAIQEIRDNTGVTQDKLKDIPNMHTVLSERLGRTVSKEQYAFLYSGRVTPGVSNIYPDTDDIFEREPFMMDFSMDGFRFVLIQVHIKPDDAEQEIRALEDVVIWAAEEYNEDDIFIMGDLNADCTYFDSFWLFPEYVWLIDEDADTTTGRTDCAYDRIIATENNPNIIDVGVDSLQEVGGDEELLKAVSDHYPVYFIYDKADRVEATG